MESNLSCFFVVVVAGFIASAAHLIDEVAEGGKAFRNIHIFPTSRSRVSLYPYCLP